MKKKIKPKVGDICMIARSIFSHNIGKIVKITAVFSRDRRVNIVSNTPLHGYDRYTKELLVDANTRSVEPEQLRLLWREPK